MQKRKIFDIFHIFLFKVSIIINYLLLLTTSIVKFVTQRSDMRLNYLNDINNRMKTLCLYNAKLRIPSTCSLDSQHLSLVKAYYKISSASILIISWAIFQEINPIVLIFVLLIIYFRPRTPKIIKEMYVNIITTYMIAVRNT